MGVLEKVACDVIERPKMPRATWDALRAHVVRERKKKKEENQEFERQKQARENKKKEDAATLEDINEQIRRTEHKLDELKKEKTTLFTTLKRVLNEQSKEKPVATTQSTYLQPSVRTAGGGPGGAGHGTGHAQFHRGAPPTQTTAQSAVGDPYAKHMLQNPGKRARSPSPPPGVRGTGGGVGGRKGPAGDGAAAAAAAAAWLQLPPASTGGGAAAVASHYAQAAAAASTGAVEFSRGGSLPQGGQGDPKMMRMGSGAVGGRPSYVMTSSSAAGVSRGAPPISHPPISTVASAGIPSRQPPQSIRGGAVVADKRLGLPGGPSGAHLIPAPGIPRTTGGPAPPFRAGSIVSGFPRYQSPGGASGSSVVTTSLATQPALSLTRQTVSSQPPPHGGPQNGGGPRYYTREN